MRINFISIVALFSEQRPNFREFVFVRYFKKSIKILEVFSENFCKKNGDAPKSISNKNHLPSNFLPLKNGSISHRREKTHDAENFKKIPVPISSSNPSYLPSNKINSAQLTPLHIAFIRTVRLQSAGAILKFPSIWKPRLLFGYFLMVPK